MFKPAPINLGSRSSLLRKLPKEFRYLLDRAIVNRDPPGYGALYTKFNLAVFGASFSALYKYARRLRTQADSLRLGNLAFPGLPDPGPALPILLACRVLKALEDGSSSARTLRDLVDSWRLAAATDLLRRRQGALLKDALRWTGAKAGDPRRPAKSDGTQARNAEVLVRAAVPAQLSPQRPQT